SGGGFDLPRGTGGPPRTGSRGRVRAGAVLRHDHARSPLRHAHAPDRARARHPASTGKREPRGRHAPRPSPPPPPPRRRRPAAPLRPTRPQPRAQSQAAAGQSAQPAPAPQTKPVTLTAGPATSLQPAGGQEKRYSGTPITLDFNGIDLRSVLRVFAEPSGLNI